MASALRAVFLDVAYSPANSFSEGISSPGSKRPLVMLSRRSSAMRWDGNPSVAGMA
jgi:hypothetical protein